jgi:hypothetical protein
VKKQQMALSEMRETECQTRWFVINSRIADHIYDVFNINIFSSQPRLHIEQSLYSITAI